MESITMIHVIDSTNLLLKIGWLDEAIMCFEKWSIYFSHFAFTLFDELCAPPVGSLFSFENDFSIFVAHLERTWI